MGQQLKVGVRRRVPSKGVPACQLHHVFPTRLLPLLQKKPLRPLQRPQSRPSRQRQHRRHRPAQNPTGNRRPICASRPSLGLRTRTSRGEIPFAVPEACRQFLEVSKSGSASPACRHRNPRQDPVSGVATLFRTTRRATRSRPQVHRPGLRMWTPAVRDQVRCHSWRS